MPDAIFEDPRLAVLYDPLDPDRSDLGVYAAIVDELGARSVLDIGCGTGTLACMLALRGIEVVGLDPAGASLDVARSKAGSDGVRWICGDASSLPPLQVDLVVMTGNVAQVFLDDEDWSKTLTKAREALGARGHLVFETRDPEREAWKAWDKEHSSVQADIADIGHVEAWVELTGVEDGLVSFRSFNVFEDGEVLTSDSTLRFRSRQEVTESLGKSGLKVDEIRDAPDRPGREFVFIASPDH